MGEDKADPILTPQADGWIASDRPVTLPFMAPRLQGEVHASGWLNLSLWGAGALGRLRFTPLEGPYRHAPNQMLGTEGGVHVASTAPVLAITGARYRSFHPARRCAAWDRSRHPPPSIETQGAVRLFEQGWGVVLAESRGEDLILAGGADRAEAFSALALSTAQIREEGQAYARRCDSLPEGDPLLRTLVSQGVHAALSAVRRDREGRFAGLAAGLAYSAPARTYYRDGYWTLPWLLIHEPAAVRDQIEILARGIAADGEAPSGVIVSGPAQSRAWEEMRARSSRARQTNHRPLDWWSDHFDSPLMFILAVGDYVRATGDPAPARKHWDKLLAIHDRYRALAPHGLPLKPRHDRDWADNVYRQGLVSYDLGLWVGALDVLVELGASIDPVRAKLAQADAVRARHEIRVQLKGPDGLYPDFIAPDGFREGHLTLDALTLLRWDAVSDDEALSVLATVRDRLETRRNPAQPHGDWGMMCAWPPFSRRSDIRAKSAFPYRYHNGSDWPYLDGIYGAERLRRGLSGWRYPLTRWWECCLERGWLGAVEYFAPPWGRGSLLQGWSGLPAAVLLAHRETVLAGDRD